MGGQVSGPIAVICAFDTDGNLQPLQCDENAYLYVKTSSTTVDASDVTYTPANLSDWDGGSDPGNVDGALDQLAERVTDNEGLIADELLPVRHEQTFGSMYVIQGTSMSMTINASEVLNAFWAFTDGNDGDNGTFSCVLKAGSYTIELIGLTGGNKGKIDIDFKYVNDVSYTNVVTAQDWYSGGAVFNVSKTATFSVVTGGRQIFKIAVNGKNASSSGYAVQLSLIMIYLTAGDS